MRPGGRLRIQRLFKPIETGLDVFGEVSCPEQMLPGTSSDSSRGCVGTAQSSEARDHLGADPIECRTRRSSEIEKILP